jgi:hypothetical protein
MLTAHQLKAGVLSTKIHLLLFHAPGNGINPQRQKRGLYAVVSCFVCCLPANLAEGGPGNFSRINTVIGIQTAV